MHSKIRAALIGKHGSAENEWWRKGVPEKVRVDCVQARERDSEFVAEPYNYTTIIHLCDILDKEWKLFKTVLPVAVADDKQAILSDLKRLNSIRNRVMHPVRSDPPGEAELFFTKGMQEKLKLAKWRR